MRAMLPIVTTCVALALALATPSCFDPHYPEGLACDGLTDCPPGQTCHAGTCTRNANGPDAGCGAPEQCNGVDDDCDGLVDETGPTDGGGCDCVDGNVEACGVETCPADGARTCAGGVWSACIGATQPVVERCDGLVDDDCDGAVDDGCLCTSGRVQPCGTCNDGLQSCDPAGHWGTCVGGTPAGACCPGQTRSCGTDTGECSTGLESCTVNGTWSGVCTGNRGPVAETCNGRDDDCDGAADEIAACTACVPLGTVTAFPLTRVAGDPEFKGHGPVVTIDTRYRRSGTQVCADVTVRMRETVSDWTEGVRTVTRCATAAGSVATVTTPNSMHGYTDNDPNDFDTVPVQPGTGIGSIQCTGDTNGPDLCSDSPMPNCSGCQVQNICARVTYQ